MKPFLISKKIVAIHLIGFMCFISCGKSEIQSSEMQSDVVENEYDELQSQAVQVEPFSAYLSSFEIIEEEKALALLLTNKKFDEHLKSTLFEINSEGLKKPILFTNDQPAFISNVVNGKVALGFTKGRIFSSNGFRVEIVLFDLQRKKILMKKNISSSQAFQGNEMLKDSLCLTEFQLCLHDSGKVDVVFSIVRAGVWMIRINESFDQIQEVQIFDDSIPEIILMISFMKAYPLSGDKILLGVHLLNGQKSLLSWSDAVLNSHRVSPSFLQNPFNKNICKWVTSNFLIINSNFKLEAFLNFPEQVFVYDMAYNNGRLALVGRYSSESNECCDVFVKVYQVEDQEKSQLQNHSDGSMPLLWSWDKPYSFDFQYHLGAVALSRQGEVFAGGRQGYVQVPTGSCIKPGNAWIMKLDQDGQLVKTETFGNERNNGIISLAVTENQVLWATGLFNGPKTHDSPEDQYNTIVFFKSLF